jgi:hypothetical protein
MGKQTVSVKIDQADLRELQRAIFRMQKAVKDDLKADVMDIARDSVPAFQRSAQTTRQRQLRPTVKARKDVTPIIEFGGPQSAGVSGGASFSQMLFGTEFGANKAFLRNGGRSFPMRSPRQGRGNKGYWIFPTAKKLQPEITRRWYQSVDSVLDKWASSVG